MPGPQVGDTTEPCPFVGDLVVKIITKDGNAVANASTEIDGPSGQSSMADANGIVDFGSISTGEYLVRAWKDNYAPENSNIPCPVEDSINVQGSCSNHISLTLSPVVKIEQMVEVCSMNGSERLLPIPIARKQYINLDSTIDTNNPHPEYGRCLQCKVKVGAINGDPNLPLSGWKVYFYVKSGNQNRAGLSGLQKEGFDSEGSGIKKRDPVTTDAQGWTPVVKFFLSQYGGDEFTIYATIEPDYSGGIGAGPYTVWKKIFFDVVEMKKSDGVNKYPLTAAIINKVKTGFEKTFIELEDTGNRHLGDYKDNFDDVEKGFQWADGYCSATGVPLKIHFSIIDRAAPRNGTYGATTETVEEEAGKVLFTSSVKIRAYDFTGYTWLIKSEYQEKGSTDWKVLDSAKVSLDGTRGPRYFKVDFNGIGVTPTSTNKVKIKLTYLQPGSFGGWGGVNSLHLLICRGEYEDLMSVADADNQITVACLHEPGHAMGLVQTSEGWHDAAHVSHCVNNFCTMWYESSPGNEIFHSETVSDPGCRTFLRGKELTKSVMQPNWRFPR